MTADDRLAEVFDEGLTNGIETLSLPEQDLYRIQDFIIYFEMGGLSGYFYNRLPDFEDIAQTIQAMHRRKLPQLATLLQTALNLFQGYADPDPPSTWDVVLKSYDPDGKLGEIEVRIHALDNFELKTADIS